MENKQKKSIDLLAAAAGIEPGYWDTWGRWIEVPHVLKADLLNAIGFDLSSPEAIMDELFQFESRYWRSPLRPATVVWQSALPAAIPLAIPPRPDSRWRLLIEPEGATEISRTFRPSELPIKEIVNTKSGELGLATIQIGDGLPCGYHRVSLFVERSSAPVSQSLLIVAPDCCYLPPELLPEKKVFGIGVQVPSLCSYEDLGAGDLGQLKLAIDAVASWGGSFIGLNPLHAASYRDAGSISPYCPESRACFSPLLINVDDAARFLEIERSAGERDELALAADPLRTPDLIDHLGVWRLKRRVLEGYFDEFKSRDPGGSSSLARKFAVFIEEAHPPIHDYVAFRAIQDSLESKDPSIWGWPVWPAELQERNSPAVERFLEAEERRVDFFLFLQWLVAEQLEATRKQAADRGLTVGLYLDLALGSSAAGADVWARKDLYALEAGLGAPPDLLNVLGQDWGLPPLVPFFLEYAAYGPFIEALRANMRYAGALRIDHFMSLMRLYWVPRGRSAAQGAYIRYPFHELLGILALESQRNRCIVIGEDLGTVPEGLREEMECRSILSYKVLPFMKSAGGGFAPFGDYPRKALVTSGTHDMSTLRGWWQGADIENWQRFGMLRPPLTEEGMLADRKNEKVRLIERLNEKGQYLFDSQSADSPQGFNAAVTTALAGTRSLLQVIQAEDLFNEREQVNVPGTVDQHPNWRRRIPVPVEKWAESEAALEVLSGAREQRKKAIP